MKQNAGTTKTLLTLAMALMLSSATYAQREPFPEIRLDPFHSDGCSMFPDGHVFKKDYSWLHCCFIHDMSYWIGGTSNERREVDNEFRACVSEAHSEVLSYIMRFGVRIGGPPGPFPWSWGYGWRNTFRYHPLNEVEHLEIWRNFLSLEAELYRYSKNLSDKQIHLIREEIDKFSEYPIRGDETEASN